MKYAITKRTSVATGAQHDDPMPTHLECGTVLTVVRGEDPALPSARWQCSSCLKAGVLVLSDDVPPQRTAPSKRMRVRWTRGTPSVVRWEGGLEPLEWDNALRRYFARGLWLVGSHDDPDYTIRDDSALVLGKAIRVRIDETGRSDIAVAEADNNRWHLIPDVAELREHRPGILVAVTSAGVCTRLDSHLTPEDERCLAEARSAW